MTAMNLVEPRLRWFVERMRAKLAIPANQAKRDWRGVKVVALENMLWEEMRELALKLNGPGCPRPDLIIDECADVANFAFMIADWLNEEQRRQAEAEK